MNAVITGGGGDIGGACARLLASRGTNVLIVDANLVAAEAVAEEINAPALTAGPSAASNAHRDGPGYRALSDLAGQAVGRGGYAAIAC